ncbi:MAG TPA: protein kinase, partial [Planctomycetota bacterium]|nr:protein kinase [Planctomycetota bacterium]
MARSGCRCGGEREEVSAEIVRRLRCRSCGAEELARGAVADDSAFDSATRRHGPAAGGRGAGAVSSSTDTVEVALSLATPPPAPRAPTEPGRPWTPGRGTPDPDGSPTVLEGRGAGTSTRFLPPPRYADLAPELAAGARLGAFEIVEVLGRGGMGIVYRAREEALAREVALKVVSDALCRDAAFVDRFRREARAAAALSHPNITTIYAIGEDRGVHFYSMELVRGRNLIEVLDARGPLPATEAAQLARQAAEGLREAAARRIIHRDVKPSNLLLSESGRVKITDFGLAKAFLGAVDQTTTGIVMGTPVYMSPEQGAGRAVDHRSDLYSLGVTLYQLVFGKPPFVADSALSLMVKHLQEEPEFPVDERGPRPPSLVAILRKMLEKDPARRYASYDALIADLAAFLDGRPVAAMREQAGAGDDATILLRRSPAGGPAKPARADAPGATMSRSRISIARTNLKMGRADRSLALLRDVIREDPENRVEAALLLAEIADAQKDPKAAREALELVAKEAKEPAEQAYAALRLAAALEREAIERDRAALAA